jgi:hypothetical protein
MIIELSEKQLILLIEGEEIVIRDNKNLIMIRRLPVYEEDEEDG